MTHEASIEAAVDGAARQGRETQDLVAALDRVSLKLSDPRQQKRNLAAQVSMIVGIFAILGGMWTVVDAVSQMRVEQATAKKSVETVEKRADESIRKLEDLTKVVGEIDKRLSYIEGRNAGTKEGGR